MRKMSNVFIVILNFNGGKNIVECLKSLKNEEVKLVVVDNNSSDNSVEVIRKNFPKVKIIRNNKNLGFSQGNNAGILYALERNADFIMLLNQDCVAKNNFLYFLLKNKSDVVGPAIEFKRGKKLYYDYGGRVNWLIGRTTHQESTVYLNNYQNCNKLNLDSGNVDFISGCAMMVKRSVFEKIGLLDEKFFLYFEDVDFCLRAKKVGFRINVEPKSIVFHKLTEGKKKSFFQTNTLIKSNLIFINKHISFWCKPLAYLYWWILAFKMLTEKYL
ncbi:MAG: glycosyltransferase family 2 protein [Candidatus Marinimicrobia bacterium]|nr:glycosyltransferase family 2 protein [Candidatus Neomarinimicrobiota bacterium]